VRETDRHEAEHLRLAIREQRWPVTALPTFSNIQQARLQEFDKRPVALLEVSVARAANDKEAPDRSRRCRQPELQLMLDSRGTHHLAVPRIATQLAAREAVAELQRWTRESRTGGVVVAHVTQRP